MSALAPKQLSDNAAQRRKSSRPKQFSAKHSRRQIVLAKTVAPKSTRSPKQGAQERVYVTRVHHNHFFGNHGSFVCVVLRLSARFAKIMLVEMPERVFCTSTVM